MRITQRNSPQIFDMWQAFQRANLRRPKIPFLLFCSYACSWKHWYWKTFGTSPRKYSPFFFCELNVFNYKNIYTYIYVHEHTGLCTHVSTPTHAHIHTQCIYIYTFMACLVVTDHQKMPMSPVDRHVFATKSTAIDNWNAKKKLQSGTAFPKPQLEITISRLSLCCCRRLCGAPHQAYKAESCRSR